MRCDIQYTLPPESKQTTFEPNSTPMGAFYKINRRIYLHIFIMIYHVMSIYLRHALVFKVNS